MLSPEAISCLMRSLNGKIGKSNQFQMKVLATQYDPCSLSWFIALKTTTKYTTFLTRHSSPEKKPTLVQVFNQVKSKPFFRSMWKKNEDLFFTVNSTFDLIHCTLN